MAKYVAQHAFQPVTLNSLGYNLFLNYQAKTSQIKAVAGKEENQLRR